MASIVRAGDKNTAGGAALGGASTVTINGRSVILPGDKVTAHPCCGSRGCGKHCSAKTTGGTPTVTVEGRPVITTNDIDTCGHKRREGSPNVTVGG
jgi:uncharacterized Zn-binding protein involved in type VI secretion